MSKVKSVVLRVTTTGADGAATGSATTEQPISGEILGVALNFHASAPGATTDTTIATAGAGAASVNILVVTDSATDGYFAPRAKPVDNTNTAITNAHAPFAVNDKVTVSLAQCNALTNALIATIYYR